MARLLISAFSCFPGEGSEPGVGWKAVTEAAKEHEVWVITDCARREALKAHPDVLALPQVHWTFLRVPLLSSWAHGRWSNTAVWWLYYLVWQIAQGRLARQLHEQVRFELCHHATYVKYNTPSWLGSLGIPFLWGPVGGGEAAPLVFYGSHGWRTRFVEFVRLSLQRLAPGDLWSRRTASQATLAWAVTRETEVELETLGASRTLVWPAVSLDTREMETIRRAAVDPTSRTEGGELTLIFVGRLIPWKGIDLAIRSLAGCNRRQLRLRVIGEGHQRDSLQQLSHELGLADRVQFEGALPRSEVLSAYGSAHGLLYPSLHDSGGQVVLEAMAAGLPVICTTRGGPAVLVDENAGWKVAANHPEQTIARLSEALKEFADSSELRMARGISARSRATQLFSTEAFGKRQRDCYRQILDPAD